MTRIGRHLIGLLLLANCVPALASVVTHGYLPLRDGTLLNYTLTLPSAQGRYPTILKYDPYEAGVTSDPTWNDAGYAMLGVNFRGTGCSQGSFNVTRADQWGAEGAQVVAWAASQPWSDGSFGMIGYSFTGTSQLATAAFADDHLKAIAPGNVFPDLYRDIIYPGGVLNQWLPVWILVGRAFVGSATIPAPLSDPQCAVGVLQQLVPNSVQTPEPALHPFVDDYWSRQPSTYLDRVRVPVLGCVNWQDTTVYSRAANMFRDELNPQTTWLVGSNGTHYDCPISRARLVRFFDRYLKGLNNDWESTPHVLLIHEVTGTGHVRETLADNAGSWQTSYRDWSSYEAATTPVTLYFHPGGRLDLMPPLAASTETYDYPLRSANTPADWAGLNPWSNPVPPGGALHYTTPALTQDVEFIGGGSVNLWIASTASDVDVQVTLSEVRPDGQEMYVENGWLQLSHRMLDPQKSTPLQPYHTHRSADVQQLKVGEPVFARIELLPFNHVFRAGSAIRLSVDAPGSWMQPLPIPAVNTLYLGPETGSELVLGWASGGRSQASLPKCGTLLNQPCRQNAVPIPAGKMSMGDERASERDTGRSGGALSPSLLLSLLLALWLRRNFSQPRDAEGGDIVH